MKGFGKFITFVGVTGAALAGLWYWYDTNNKSKSESKECDCDSKEGDSERSYVSLDPDIKEDVKEVAEAAEKMAKDAAEAVSDNRETLKKAVKSAAQDIMTKAEDAARGVGLVKDEKKTSDFEFADFDKAQEKAEKAAEDVASKIDIQ
ncbi:MAG: hypothetical protein K6E49_06835 [Lachnospiraceae bacterium]|nr:hypothetical protein [Lachnospiraceae bacterium]